MPPGVMPADLPPLSQPGCPAGGQGATPTHEQVTSKMYTWSNGDWSEFATRTPNYHGHHNQLGDDTPAGVNPYATGWDANRCGLAQLSVEYRKSRVLCTALQDCNSDPETTENHPGIERAQLISLHPIRATDPEFGYADPFEPCMRHRAYSEVVNGRRRAVGCSGEDIISFETQVPREGASWGLLSVRATEDTIGRAGRARVLWPYRLPRSRSVLLTSSNCWEYDEFGCDCGVPA